VTGNTRQDIASDYIRDNFKPSDRLAVVLVHKQTGAVVQRVAPADRIATTDFQAWLHQKNAERFEVFISMNALHQTAKGRTKSDVDEIRHVFLDFDENGTIAVERLLARGDLPQPNYLVNSSPDKWQVVWKVDGFAKSQAEELQKGLAQEAGADPAATDCSRVLRLPGFYNHKYAKRHYIEAQSLSRETYGPERFPALPAEERTLHAITGKTDNNLKTNTGSGKLSQSERDWAYAKRALARGETEADIITAIASYRRYDKHDPQYYAEHTVHNAAAALQADTSRTTVRESGRHR
jgi:hypothetical protein